VPRMGPSDLRKAGGRAPPALSSPWVLYCKLMPSDVRAQPLPPLAPRECARPPPWLAPRQRAKAHPCSKFFRVSQQGREYASRCYVQVQPAYLAAGDRVMIMTGSKEALHGCTGVIAEVKPGPELLVAVSACAPLSPAQSRERGAKRGEARLRELIAEVFDELAGGRLLSLAYGDDHLSESGATPSLATTRSASEMTAPPQRCLRLSAS